MKKMKFLASVLGLIALAVPGLAGEDVGGPKPNKKPPVITLPPEERNNIAKFDAIKAAEALPWHVTQNKCPEAWATNKNAKGAKIKVAVIDTGAQTDHPYFEGKIGECYNAITKTKGAAAVRDGNGHGTWCCGAVHAIAPEAEILVIKVLSDAGSGSVADIAHGIDYAVSAGADVLSLSLGGDSPDEWIPPALDRATKAGVLFIAAAGNAGGPGNTEGYPGRYPQAFSVAAADKARNLASFSSWGPNVVTTDFGVDVNGPLPGNNMGDMSGTSMATPQSAGKAASWCATHPEVNKKDRPAEYRKQLIAASPFAERNNARGYGLVTLDKLTPAATTPTPPTPNPGKPTIQLTMDDLSPAAQAKLAAAGFDAFALVLGSKAKPAEVPPPLPVGMTPIPENTGGGITVVGRCTGPNCQAPQPAQFQQEGWYPGKAIDKITGRRR